MYLECPLGIPIDRLETFYGNIPFRVSPVAHNCEPTVAVLRPDLYEVLLEYVRGGKYLACSADLGEEP